MGGKGATDGKERENLLSNISSAYKSVIPMESRRGSRREGLESTSPLLFVNSSWAWF